MGLSESRHVTSLEKRRVCEHPQVAKQATECSLRPVLTLVCKADKFFMRLLGMDPTVYTKENCNANCYLCNCLLDGSSHMRRFFRIKLCLHSHGLVFAMHVGVFADIRNVEVQ